MAEAQSSDNHLLNFARMFKGYMGVMPIVTASLAPVLTALNVIPTYASQRKPLAAMAGILGFLLLAWLFYVRRTIALGSITRGPRMLINLCPFLLILASIGCYIGYAITLDTSLETALKPPLSASSRAEALGSWSNNNAIPRSPSLQLFFLGMFLCPEAAFVMMALREYANEVRQISEYDWMFGKQDGSDPLSALPKTDAHSNAP
jgi:hypothetical protein